MHKQHHRLRQSLSIEAIFIIILGAGAYVGWNMGANDTANWIWSC